MARAQSKKQQMAAGAALAAKRGDMPKSRLRGSSKQMAASMNERDLDELASTKRKKLPSRKARSAKSSARKSGARGSAGRRGRAR